ncbi:hypothetical protein EJ110_NYTH40474 [Nymphaea thermarum]|nr:hypothetical protein EJ110_NYTH40474 [Nymphaea thermarum]
MAQIPVELLFEMLADLLVKEARLQSNVRPELEEIKKLELQNTRSFLKDADSRAERDGEVPDSVKEWVEQLRTAGYDKEDIVYEFMLRFGGRGRSEVVGTLAFFLRRLNSVALPFQRHRAR